jgi:hypothetical protein
MVVVASLTEKWSRPGRLLYTSEDCVRYDVGPSEAFLIEIIVSIQESEKNG